MFHARPESIARRRHAALDHAERQFKKGLRPPLSHKEQNELEVLRQQKRADDERKWLEQLGEIKRKESQDADNRQNLELLEKSRIRNLEERRACGFKLTESEEGELRDVRGRHPDYTAVMDLMDLPYLCEWAYEVTKAKGSGLSTFAACEQADIVCLRLRDPNKFTTESDAEEYRRSGGKTTEAASLER